MFSSGNSVLSVKNNHRDKFDNNCYLLRSMSWALYYIFLDISTLKEDLYDY